MCTWCKLILILRAESAGQAQQVRYPGDATIAGRVTAVTIRIEGDQP